MAQAGVKGAPGVDAEGNFIDVNGVSHPPGSIGYKFGVASMPKSDTRDQLAQAGIDANTAKNGSNLVSSALNGINATVGQIPKVVSASKGGLDPQGGAEYLQDRTGLELPGMGGSGSGSMSGLQDQVKNAADLSQRFANDLNNYRPGTAPQAAQPRVMNAALVREGVRADPAAVANMARSDAARVDTGQQGQIRAQQEQALGMLTDAAAGRAPSAAEQMLQRASDRAMQQQFAMAASARGNQVAGAGRAAMMNAAAINSDAMEQARIQRAQEQATARGQLVGALSDTRGQDIGLATTQAGFQQQTNLANQQAFNQGEMFNAGAANSNNQLNAQFAQQVMLQNQDAVNRFRLQQQQLGTQTALANLDAQLKQSGLDQDQQRMLIQAILQGNQQAIQGNAAAVTAEAAAKQAQNAFYGGLLQTGGTMFMASDRTLKTDVKPIADKSMDAFLAALKPYSYRYKSGGTGPGEAEGDRAGIMAQDLERSDVGRTLVALLPNGKKGVDVQQAVGVLLASAAAMHKRMKKLEGRR